MQGTNLYALLIYKSKTSFFFQESMEDTGFSYSEVIQVFPNWLHTNLKKKIYKVVLYTDFKKASEFIFKKGVRSS